MAPALYLGARLVSGCSSRFESAPKLHTKNLNRNVEGTRLVGNQTPGFPQARGQGCAGTAHSSACQESSPTGGRQLGGLGVGAKKPRTPAAGSREAEGAKRVVPSLAARRRGTGPRSRSRRHRRRIASVLEPRVTVALAACAPSSRGGSLMPHSL